MAVAPVVATPVEAAPASTDRPSGIFIPKWVGLVAAAIVAALIFGGIGYAIGDSSDSGSSQAASNNFPNGTRNGNGTQTLPGGGQFPGNGELPNGNGSGGSGSNGGGTTTSNGAFLGIGVQTSTDPKGVAVTQVADNSPASKAGLQQGDVITAIDGNSITSADALRTAVQAKASGDEISVTYTRDGQSSTVKATLTSRSQTQSN
jgi:membrane-associated protease RseP (regulator of RpoE activity)